MADNLYIGIDSGTQGTKAVVLSEGSAEIIAESYHGYELIENDRGGREQRPERWIQACREVLREILASSAVDGVYPAAQAGGRIRCRLSCHEPYRRGLGGESRLG